MLGAGFFLATMSHSSQNALSASSSSLSLVLEERVRSLAPACCWEACWLLLWVLLLLPVLVVLVVVVCAEEMGVQVGGGAVWDLVLATLLHEEAFWEGGEG